MDIKLLDSWIREHLDTNAKPEDIARCMSLCGPTFDRTHKVKVNGKVDYLYEIEVTTNRVDAMSVRGIAREAAVILPEFGFKAKLKPLKLATITKQEKSVPLKLKTSPKLTNRVMGVVLEVDKIDKSPQYISQRLEQTGIRSLNAAVDVTNYVMTELGHPTHVFDYDLIAPSMTIRESKKGEKLVSLENKEYKLPGGDIVIENDKGEIIDLPGIIGTENSVVRNTTKRILFFLETNDPVHIRKTSMTLGIRTVAATLNEKGVDPELAEITMKRGIELFQKLLNAKVISKIHDVYPKKQKSVAISLDHSFIESRLGVQVSENRVTSILSNLEFDVSYNKSSKRYTVTPPSFRAKDIVIPEDVVEEIARIYGYHNLPNTLMTGTIPMPSPNAPFEFEMKIRNILKELQGHEIYTYSLVSEEAIVGSSLELKNPLGTDYSQLRDSLAASLVAAAKNNSRETEMFHIFELANIYIPNKRSLPEEQMKLAGIIANSDYRHAKGIVEALLEALHIPYDQSETKNSLLARGEGIDIISKKKTIGVFGRLAKQDLYYYEFSISDLLNHHKSVKKYNPIPKYPAHIEDSTFTLPEGTTVQSVLTTIESASNKVTQVELTDIYDQNYTFRIYYQDEKKTLTGSEVEKIREQVFKAVKEKHRASIEE